MKKTVLVSGGSRGIGKEIVKTLAKDGHDVIFTYLSNTESANQLCDELFTEHNLTVKAAQCNMAEMKEVKALFKEIKLIYGGVDVIVNNAGILGRTAPFLMTPDNEWWHVFNTNVACFTNPIKVGLTYMIKQKAGSIINITSLSGQKGNPGQSAYAASKAAITAFSKSLLKEVGKLNIHINNVAPGFIETDMTEDNNEYQQKRLAGSILKRPGRPDEVASLVQYLVNEAPLFLTGQEITIDGGIGV